MKNCIFCHSELFPPDVFCPRCGESQGLIDPKGAGLGGIKPAGCIKCGYQHGPNDAFCRRCGWYVKDKAYVDDGLVMTVSQNNRTFHARPDLPRAVTDITEFWEYFLLMMRHDDSRSVLNPCFEVIRRTLDHPAIPESVLDRLAAISADNVYKACAWISYLDENVMKYCWRVIGALFKSLETHHRHLLCILDNTLDEQRLKTTETILNACGFAVILSAKNGMPNDLKKIREEIRTHVKAQRNIFYIEPDSSANYLNAIIAETGGIKDYIQTFRNEAPQFNSFVRLIPKD